VLVFVRVFARRHANAQAGLEKQIDWLVYKSYDLTPEEIAIVEGNR